MLAGDLKPVGDGVVELRCHFGPGYRVYVYSEGDLLIVLLMGGDKPSQSRDIAAAQRILKEWKYEHRS